MTARNLSFLLAAVVAGVILVVTIFFGSGLDGRNGQRSDAGDFRVPTLDTPYDPNNPQGITPGSGEDVTYFTTLEDGQVVKLQGDEVRPQPDGLLEFIRPRFEIILKTNQVLVVTADEARVYAPENHVRNGQVFGIDNPLVVRLYESDQPDRKPHLGMDSKDLRMVGFFQEADFDLEVGNVHCRGPVHVSTADVDFQGFEARITYNPKRDRIEKMIVERGKVMRVAGHQKQEDSATSQPGDATTSSTLANSNQQNADDTPAEGVGSESLAAATDTTLFQWYEGVFNRGVRIETLRTVARDADTLRFQFALGKAYVDPQNESGAAVSRLNRSLRAALALMSAPTPTPLATRHQPSLPQRDFATYITTGAAWLAPAVVSPVFAMADSMVDTNSANNTSNSKAKADPREMLPESLRDDQQYLLTLTRSITPLSNDDTFITWQGRLILDALENPPRDMQREDDIYVELKPALVSSKTEAGENETIIAGRLDYLSSTRRFRLFGSDIFPLRVSSDRMGGILESNSPEAVGNDISLVLAQDEQWGKWDGPGTFRAFEGAAATTQPSEGRSLAPGSQIRWRDHVNLSFYIKPANEVDRNEPVRVSALRSADFFGRVVATHPDFDLQGEHITVEASPPVQGKQDLDKLRAKGNARLVTRGQESVEADVDQQSLSVQADQLDVNMVQPDHRPAYPSRLLAVGNVNAVTPAQKLSAGMMDVYLGPEPDFASMPVLADLPSKETHSVPSLQAAQGFDVETDSAPLLPEPVQTDPFSPWVPKNIFDSPEDDASNQVEEAAPEQETDQTNVEEAEPEAQPDNENRTTGEDASSQPSSEESSPGKKPARITVHRLVAHDDVEINLQADETTLLGDRVTIDNISKRLTLISLSKEPAAIIQPGRELHGRQIVMLQETASAEVTGEGWMIFEGSPDASEESTPNMRNPSPVATVAKHRIDWTESMRFEDQRGYAQFVGDVRFDSNKLTERTALNSDELEIHFAMLPDVNIGTTPQSNSMTSNTRTGLTNQDAVTNINESSPQSFGLKANPGKRQIERIVAQQNKSNETPAIFLHEKWLDADRETLTRRFQLKGPLLQFDYLPEQVRVIGPGSMLTQDLQSQDDEANAEKDKPTPGSSLASGGPGDTLFKWQESMLLDLAENDMTLKKSVRVIHRPLGQKQTIQLDCQKLFADVGETGGLKSWSGESQPGAELRAIYADGDGSSRVFISSPERQAVCDNLTYNAVRKRMILESKGDLLVQMTTAESPTTYTAKRINWYLDKDRIEFVQPGPAMVPER